MYVTNKKTILELGDIGIFLVSILRMHGCAR